MVEHNANNERIKRQYFVFLKEAKRHSEATVDAVAKALARFEGYSKFRDFKAFHTDLAVAFKKHLAEQDSKVTGEKLSKATLHATLAELKRFFQWLAGQPGYKSRLKYSDAEFFNLSDKETRIATAQREKKFPTLEQVKHVIGAMPSNSEIEQRRSCAPGVYPTDRRAGQRHCFNDAQARRPCGKLRLPGRPRCEYQSEQDLHYILFPRRR